MITVIPAIDIIDGKCVRLEQGNYKAKKVYAEDPVDLAKKYEDFGFTRLHLVDLDGAKEQYVVNIKILEKIAKSTTLIIDFGGGIKTQEDVDLVLNAGASMISIGSIAVKDKNLLIDWLEKYGSEKIILCTDVLNNKIAINGWQKVTEVNIFEFLDGYYEEGIKNILCTDISKDGMLQGVSMELYTELKERFPTMYLIASGGVTHVADIDTLNDIGVEAVVVGKALYENSFQLDELKKFIK
jgi:phosphoribosylformimino-5-aminoimidazole carboxamide ribotide isomerase